MEKHLVSIITPLYNAEQYIEEAISSVIAQTYTNWEMIIVDDKSTDDSFSRAKRLANGDKRISLYRLEQNAGSAVARNHGLALAKGKYVSFLDADDFLDPQYIAEQVAFMATHGPIVSAAYRRMTKETVSDFFVPEDVTYEQLLKGNPLSCLSTMYDKDVFADMRFDEDLKRHEDYLFWLSMLKRGYVAHGNQKVLATYRLLPQSKNSKKLKLILPMIKMYHNKIGLSWLQSVIYVLRYSSYSRKKYQGVR